MVPSYNFVVVTIDGVVVVGGMAAVVFILVDSVSVVAAGLESV